VNNAATVTKEQPLLETPISDLLQVIDVNLKGPLLMTRLLVPLMKDRHGMVINVGSRVGRIVRTGLVAYGTSKAGLRHLSANIAVEFAEMEGFAGVHVFALDPGGMDTALRYVAYPEETDKSALADPIQVAPFFTRLAVGWMTTDVETGQPLRSGQELVVKRYMPELWPGNRHSSQGKQQGRLSQGSATTMGTPRDGLTSHIRNGNFGEVWALAPLLHSTSPLHLGAEGFVVWVAGKQLVRPYPLTAP
jgi:NAD(P)-dependent dehydrogenase (short-subunit alcohol dehydrogenase family)